MQGEEIFLLSLILGRKNFKWKINGLPTRFSDKNKETSEENQGEDFRHEENIIR